MQVLLCVNCTKVAFLHTVDQEIFAVKIFLPVA